jgi:hypothetical protein
LGNVVSETGSCVSSSSKAAATRRGVLGPRAVDAGVLGAALEAAVDVQRRDPRDVRGAHMRPFPPATAHAAACHLDVFMRR